MSELVDRLREMARTNGILRQGDPVLPREAADRIEELEEGLRRIVHDYDTTREPAAATIVAARAPLEKGSTR